MIWSQLSTCWYWGWHIYIQIQLGQVYTTFHLNLICMDTFAVLKVLFVLLSGPLCSAPFFISFLCNTVSCCFFQIPFLLHFTSPLSCPSFCFLSVSSHFLSLCFLSHILVHCPPPSLPSLSLWFSITLYQLCLLHNSYQYFFSFLMFPDSPGAEHFLLMWLL